MIDRINILKCLISFSQPLNEISHNLANLHWDPEGEPFIVESIEIVQVLKKYTVNEINSLALEQWANMIECREDIVFQKSKENEIAHIIYYLANPELEGEVTPELCKRFIKELH